MVLSTVVPSIHRAMSPITNVMSLFFSSFSLSPKKTSTIDTTQAKLLSSHMKKHHYFFSRVYRKEANLSISSDTDDDVAEKSTIHIECPFESYCTYRI